MDVECDRQHCRPKEVDKRYDMTTVGKSHKLFELIPMLVWFWEIMELILEPVKKIGRK
jgi:hypothetical protein